MAEKAKDGLLKRFGRGFDRYIGGLLGEDLESMTPEERANARRQAIGAIGRSMMDPASASEQYGAVTQARAQQRARGELERRTAAAEAAMPDIASRLFGGTGGRRIEELPGAGGESTPLTARRVPTREGAREALGMLYGTQVGQDVAKLTPGLVDVATEGVTGRTVGGAVYNPLTGGFARPPEAPKQGGAMRAAGGGGAPGAAGAGRRFRNLTAEEVAAERFPEGTVVQLDTQTGAMKPLSTVPTAQRTGEEAKGTALERVNAVSQRILSHMDKVKTGGMIGATGALSRVFDSQDARLFESYRQQLSAAVRTALRIPGEGALSDREQAQYGLQLPELGQSRENNEEILASLQEQIKLAAGQSPAAPRAGAAGGPPPAAAPVAPAVQQYIYRNGRLVPAQPR